MRRRVVLSRRGAAKRYADFKSQIEFTLRATENI